MGSEKQAKQKQYNFRFDPAVALEIRRRSEMMGITQLEVIRRALLASGGIGKLERLPCEDVGPDVKPPGEVAPRKVTPKKVAAGEVIEIEKKKYKRSCFHRGEGCLGEFQTDNPESITCVPCVMAGHNANPAEWCFKCEPGGPEKEVEYGAGAKALGAVEVVTGIHACRCRHCGAPFRSVKGASLCAKCAGRGHKSVEPKECWKCQEGQAV